MGSMANGERDGSTGPRDATGLDAYGDRVGLLRGSMANGERDGSTGPRDATGLDACGDRVGLLRGSMATEIGTGVRDLGMHGSRCMRRSGRLATGSMAAEIGMGVRDLGMQRVSMREDIGSTCYGEAWQRTTGREYGTSGCM